MPNLRTKECECKIRGIVEMYDVRKSIWFNVHPDNIMRRLRKFKFCPICGRKLK